MAVERSLNNPWPNHKKMFNANKNKRIKVQYECAWMNFMNIISVRNTFRRVYTF